MCKKEVSENGHYALEKGEGPFFEMFSQNKHILRIENTNLALKYEKHNFFFF